MRVLVAAVVIAAAAGPSVGSAAPADQKSGDAQAACVEMMQGRGMSEEGRRAMHEVMKSGKGPEMMDQMMQMARRMGSGDVMAGMVRMTEMMGRGCGGMMGRGMMGDQGGMMGPGQQAPKQ